MFVALLFLLVSVTSAQRIEHEHKIRVPLELQETLWKWLLNRYQDPSWLNQEKFRFRSEFGDEVFTDYYFDTKQLSLMRQGHGIRHRSRSVISGAAIQKDERQLLQIKLNPMDDSNGLTRIEHKLDVIPWANPKTELLSNLVVSRDRNQLHALLKPLKVVANELLTFLMLKQHRQRIYLSDDSGPLATLTLDLVTSNSWLSNVKWLEIELELNEIRYTNATTQNRLLMTQITETIKHDLLTTFSELAIDQTPKYDMGFQMVVKHSPLPVLWLVNRGITEELLSTLFLTLVLVVIALAFFLARKYLAH